MAAVATMTITISLTIYACTTSTDLTVYGGGAFIFMTIALIFGKILIYAQINLSQRIFYDIHK